MVSDEMGDFVTNLHFEHVEFLSRFADKVIDSFDSAHIPPSLLLRALGRALAERDYPEYLECMLNTAADMASECEREEGKLSPELSTVEAE